MREPEYVSHLTWSEVSPLRRPLLLVAFEGVFDAAESATTALQWIVKRSASERLAEIDPEVYFNFQEARPLARIADDGNRVIDWPSTKVEAVRTDSARDLVVMTGVEPHLRWNSFSDHVVEVARRSGCEMVVTVGAMPAMVPHTRPFAVIGSAIHPDLARRLNLSEAVLSGPDEPHRRSQRSPGRRQYPGDLIAGVGSPLRARTTKPEGHPSPAPAPAADNGGAHLL